MQLNPLPMTAITPKPQPVTAPSVQSAILTASLASQSAAAPQRTQTLQAPQAAGKTDGSRQAQSGPDAERNKDTNASTATARTNGMGYRTSHRGTMLDVSV